MRQLDFGLPTSSYMAFHFAIPGSLSWFTGLGFLLPSLGPSIFLLSNLLDDEMNYPQRIIGGQTIGGLSGIVAFELIVGQPVTGNPIPARSLLGLKIVLAISCREADDSGDVLHEHGALSSLRHCAHRFPWFIASLTALIVFIVAVLLMALVHEIFGKRLPLWNLPYQREY